MTLMSWFVLLNQHDQCIQIHKQSSSNEKSFTEWIDQNQVLWQPHTHIYVYTWESMFVKMHVLVQWHTHEKFLWPFWLFWPMYHFFQTQTQVGQSGKFPFSHQTQVEQRDQSSNNKRAYRSGNRWLCHAWAFSGRSNKTAQQWTTLREKTEKGHI